MKVHELIKQLSKLDPNTLVVMACDSEGNCYSPLYDFGIGMYRPECSYYGELVDEEGKIESSDVPCIVLWPTN